MKQFRASALFIILALILFASPYPALADQNWHYQALAEVERPGLIETVLPAGVFFGPDSAARTSQLCPTLNTRSQLYQTSLAVTIQQRFYQGLYGNRPGSSGGCHA